MSFKSKTIGIIAGTALTLSIASGAMAQGTSVPSSAKLTETSCSIAFQAASSADFGTWSYSSAALSGAGGWIPNTVSPTGTNSINLTVVDSASGRQANCPVTVSATGLGASSTWIPLTLESPSVASATASNATAAGIAISVAPDNTTGTVVTASIPAVVDNALPAGTYNGTIVVTDNSSAST